MTKVSDHRVLSVKRDVERGPGHYVCSTCGRPATIVSRKHGEPYAIHSQKKSDKSIS